jgi:hypothetical protein
MKRFQSRTPSIEKKHDIHIKKFCVPHPYKHTVEVKLLSSSLTTRIEITEVGGNLAP